jgi:hypothetical protein
MGSPEEDHQKIIKALEEGRVEWSSVGKRYFERAGGIANEPDFTVVEAIVTDFWGPWGNNQGGMTISWSTISAGFGSISLFLKDDKLYANTEGMSKAFVKEVFNKLIDGI